MANVHWILKRHDDEAIEAFKARCAAAASSICIPGWAPVACMTIKGNVLEADPAWGGSQPGVPANECVIASYHPAAAGSRFHPFSKKDVTCARVNPPIAGFQAA